MYRVKTYNKDGKLIQTYYSHRRDNIEYYVGSAFDKLKGIKHVKSWEEDTDEKEE
jgi:hypothetical protein